MGFYPPEPVASANELSGVAVLGVVGAATSRSCGTASFFENEARSLCIETR